MGASLCLGGLAVTVKCPLGNNACRLPRSAAVPKPAFLCCVKRLNGKTGNISAAAILCLVLIAQEVSLESKTIRKVEEKSLCLC